jgi:AcrR family transcriptional regulator
MRAALAVLGRRGVAGATAQEVSQVAGVASGTFYSHFGTWEEMLRSLALWFADSYCRHIDESYAHVVDGAERMAIGNRRYILFACDSAQWAKLILGLADAGAPLLDHVGRYPLRDLRMGLEQKRFRISSERAAMDLIAGTVLQAMRTVLAGEGGRSHASATAATVLRGLGMPYDEAEEVARRPLPALRVKLPDMPKV